MTNKSCHIISQKYDKIIYGIRVHTFEIIILNRLLNVGCIKLKTVCPVQFEKQSYCESRAMNRLFLRQIALPIVSIHRENGGALSMGSMKPISFKRGFSNPSIF